MPEGDTIFRAAIALRKALVGARVTRVNGNLGRAPLGERIEEVTSRGKNLLVRFEKGRTLRTHMMLHGSWHIYREGERWRRPAFLVPRAPRSVPHRGLPRGPRARFAHRPFALPPGAQPDGRAAEYPQCPRRFADVGLRPFPQALPGLWRSRPRQDDAADHVLLRAMPEVIEDPTRWDPSKI